ncbi:MAG: hypothetical protein R3C99_03915 [Pirellulaceae bacterium]|nr:hypothetical protein [Planctomycetales bacterium]MCA9223209.1 hypothetical protein [Planctomycetales bacterium]
MRKFGLLSTVVMMALTAGSVLAQDATTETVLGDLTNPAGIAIQPKTGHVFVSDSGAGRVIRVVDGKAQEVIVGFPKDVYGKGPMYDIGPLGLVFLDEKTLVIGGGGLPDGEEMLRVYEVPEAGAEPIKADAMVSSYKLEGTDDIKGEGNFYGVAATKDAVYVTSNGDDTKGWVGKAAIKGSKVESFVRSIATKEAVNVDAPVGVTISPRGEVVIGQMGEISVPNDGLVSFYGASDGKLLLNVETGLSDITALAYSPKSEQLYATDFSWHDTSMGGLFQLVSKREDGKQTVDAKKVTSLDKPTAMAFGEDGTLYITVIGEPGKGKLLKIGPGL